MGWSSIWAWGLQFGTQTSEFSSSASHSPSTWLASTRWVVFRILSQLMSLHIWNSVTVSSPNLKFPSQTVCFETSISPPHHSYVFLKYNTPLMGVEEHLRVIFESKFDLPSATSLNDWAIQARSNLQIKLTQIARWSHQKNNKTKQVVYRPITLFDADCTFTSQFCTHLPVYKYPKTKMQKL